MEGDFSLELAALGGSTRVVPIKKTPSSSPVVPSPEALAKGPLKTPTSATSLRNGVTGPPEPQVKEETVKVENL